MNWQELYLVCFYIGLALSVFGFLGSFHLHLPHVHLHGGGHGARGAAWFNFATLAAFLAWFGGTGYLLNRHGMWFGLALAIATLSGIGAGTVVFWFVAKFMISREAPLDPADYDMTGVLGKLSIPIRHGGTGELIYSQEGTRRVAGARSEDGAAIAKGAEVIVTRYEKGIAYVRPWDDFTGELKN